MTYVYFLYLLVDNIEISYDWTIFQVTVLCRNQTFNEVNSVRRRMLFGIANAHTRKIPKSKPYAVLLEMQRTGDLGIGHHPTGTQATWCPFCKQLFYQRGNMRHRHVFCEGEKLKATRQAYYGILERKLVEIISTSEEVRRSNANTAPHLLDFIREYLREDELAPYQVDAWKERCRLENEIIFEPGDC